MNRLNRHLAHLIRRGQSATVYYMTGDACPCWTYQGTGYNKAYHRLSGSVADCNGTGILITDQTTTQIPIKSQFFLTDLVGISSLPDDIRSAIGKIINAEYIMIGAVRTDTEAQFDLTTLYERKDYISYNSINLIVRKVIKLPSNIQVGALERKT